MPNRNQKLILVGFFLKKKKKKKSGTSNADVTGIEDCFRFSITLQVLFVGLAGSQQLRICLRPTSSIEVRKQTNACLKD
jgi:hypothetical protein